MCLFLVTINSIIILTTILLYFNFLTNLIDYISRKTVTITQRCSPAFRNQKQIKHNLT